MRVQPKGEHVCYRLKRDLYPNTFKFTPKINLISDCVRKNIENSTLFLASLARPILVIERLLYRKCYTTEYSYGNTRPEMPTIQVHKQKI